jgi:RsiW-degrading membrane proteinase PrsW (M82 family)
MESRPGGPYRTKEPEAPTKSQLIPLPSVWKQLAAKAHFIPFVILFLLSFLVASPFLWLIACVLAMGSYYLVYKLCGKVKPVWLPLVPAAMTAILMLPGPWTVIQSIFGLFLFGGQLPPPQTWSTVPFPTLFYQVFFFVGLKEEFVKALPVLVCAFLAPKIAASFARPLEIREPLDGILLATGSALGFTLYETMSDYLPGVVHDSGFGAGIDLLLRRVGGDIAGHIAYSGYLGYFIGLAMLRPKNRWLTIGIGWGCAALLHTLWDSIESLPIMLGVGIVSYGFLGAAILKARQISPSRSENFATQLYRGGEPPPPPPFQPASYAPPPPPPPAPAPPMTFSSVPTPHALTFLVAGERLLLTPGRRLIESEMPGLRAAAGDGVVAEVTRHPTDPNIIGLKNLSTVSWTAAASGSEWREVLSGKTIRLAPGTSVQFAGNRGEILQ